MTDGKWLNYSITCRFSLTVSLLENGADLTLPFVKGVDITTLRR